MHLLRGRSDADIKCCIYSKSTCVILEVRGIVQRLTSKSGPHGVHYLGRVHSAISCGRRHMSRVGWIGRREWHASCVRLCIGDVVIQRIGLRVVGVGSVVRRIRNRNGVEGRDLARWLHGRVDVHSAITLRGRHCHRWVIIGDLVTFCLLVFFLLCLVFDKRTLLVNAVGNRPFLLFGRRDRTLNGSVGIVPRNHGVSRSWDSVVHGPASIWQSMAK